MSEGDESNAVQKVYDLKRKYHDGEWSDGGMGGATEGEGAMKVVNQRGKQDGI